MFSRLPSPVKLEEEVLAFWEEQRIFERSLDQSRGRPAWVFYEGPPTANGMPHNGHVLTRVMKDIFPRYKTMRGFHVDRKAGWDTHGLPVEVEVEKRLGIHGREAITAHGLEPFARECVDSVFSYVQEWEGLTRQIGFWVDLDAYVTYHRSYVESVWWALSELFKKDLLYQGHKVVWWWPQGGTALSSGEVGMGYREVVDPAITVRFRDADDPAVSYLAWTTTPWTLASNVALSVAADEEYAYCEDPAGGTVVLATALAESFGLEPRRTCRGTELVGRRYLPLFDFGPVEGGRSYVIVPSGHVTMDAGTGIVHTAPAFGEEDMVVARDQGLGLLQWIQPDGRFAEGAGWLAGRFCKEADPDIIDDLDRRGLLFHRDSVRHEYPFCWRADDDPLIQYARPAWFIRTTSRVDQAIDNNQAVGWHPEHIKDGRFGDFLRNNVDWALSRERFWGTPLNIWVCEACEHQVAPPSAAAIEALNPDAFDPSVDRDLQVHRPWIDRVTLPCPECGGTMHRVPEVIDAWFDSGCMPFAQFGFPHKGVDRFRAAFPADFISEAVDQTRGWFYSLLMISTLVFDDETCARFELGRVGFPRPYRNCIVLGHVCDLNGRKESKSKGNYTSPFLVLRGRSTLTAVPAPELEPGTAGLRQEQIDSLELGQDAGVVLEAGGVQLELRPVSVDVPLRECLLVSPDDLAALGLGPEGGQVDFLLRGEAPGADAFRWLFCAANPPWNNTRLSLRAIREGQREFLMRLRNVYQFFSIYADIAVEAGSFAPGGHAPRSPAQRSSLDRWVLHRMHHTCLAVADHLDGYRLYEASRALMALVDDLSNWYVRRSRSRFWGEGDDLADALWTLYEVLVLLSRTIAPFVPFTAEALYQSLVVEVHGGSVPTSVHLSPWPELDESLLDPQLAADMELVRALASLGLAARSSARIKVRQPLEAATVVLADPDHQRAVAGLADILAKELNVREIRFATDAHEFVDYQVKPDFRKLGPRLGKDVKRLAARLASADGAQIMRALDSGGLEVDLGDRTVTVAADELVVRVQPRGGYQSASSPEAVVAISTSLTEDLRAEGMVRELINRIQNLRKELDLGYTQRIDLQVDGGFPVRNALAQYGAHLTHETLAIGLHVGGPPEGEEWVVREWAVEGHRVEVWLKPLQ